MQPDHFLDQEIPSMQRREVGAEERKEVPGPVPVDKNEEEDEVETWTWVYKRAELWVPLVKRHLGFKTPFCGSRMKSTKKRKTIVKKSSFQKVHF